MYIYTHTLTHIYILIHSQLYIGADMLVLFFHADDFPCERRTEGPLQVHILMLNTYFYMFE